MCGVSHIPAVMQIACFLVFPFFHVVWCLWDEFCIQCAKLAMCEFLFLQACDSGWWLLGLLCQCFTICVYIGKLCHAASYLVSEIVSSV